MGFEEYSKNKLMDTIHCMEIFTLKDSVKKDTFFHKLPNLLPLLASALEFGYGASLGLTALLKMGSLLSTEEFSVKYCHVIEAPATYGESLSAQVVDEQVDEEPAIRTNTTILLGNIASYLDE
ncbi:hypothetical protein OIU84_001747 [Salix udensis]|uniref:Uncharacterized protein n=1 Tax=Salix udensis TaxID=889485 RepID=A0AAD6K881_9ROSI|nr:hypothetical protein OIU84_001747 [Salix udensis]